MRLLLITFHAPLTYAPSLTQYKLEPPLSAYLQMLTYKLIASYQADDTVGQSKVKREES